MVILLGDRPRGQALAPAGEAHPGQTRDLPADCLQIVCLYRRFGDTGLEDRRGGPRRVWNRIPDAVRGRVLDMALEQPELNPRELAVTFTDTKAQVISESSVYRLLKALA